MNNVDDQEQRFTFRGHVDPKTKLPSGPGKLYFQKSDRMYLNSDFRHGLPNGKDCQIYYDRGKLCCSLRYRGEVVNGERHGDGIEFMPCGNLSYSGNFVENYYNGKSAAYYCMTNGKCTYKGAFKSNKKDGFGISYHDNGQIKYVGEWKNNYPKDGQITIFKKGGGISYRGLMKNGRSKCKKPFICFC